MDSKQSGDSDHSLEQSTDAVIDQAEALIWSLLDDEIQPSDIKVLETLLKENAAVRDRYIECVQMHTDLHQHFGEVKAPTGAGTTLPKSPVLGSLGDLRPGTDTLPLRD